MLFATRQCCGIAHVYVFSTVPVGSTSNAQPGNESGTFSDRILNRIKNNPIVAVLILLGAIVTALAAFREALKGLLDQIFRRPEAARSELSRIGLKYDFVESAVRRDLHAVKTFLAARKKMQCSVAGLLWRVGLTVLIEMSFQNNG